ncbi:MAG TPA: MFS transporter [Herbaspirillum sp.]|jgi:AAHS family 4-hydroxybenzoate transporter-like MFS transporter
MTPYSPNTDTLDVQKFIDAQPFSRYQWVVLILSFLIMVADGFDTAAIGFVAPALSREWGITKLALGPVLSASLIGMALGALIAGPCADRFGRKPVLLLFVSAFGFFSLASGCADSIITLTALRFFTGLGLGAATPIATTLLSESSPTRRRSLLLNCMFCGFTLGAAAGGFGAAMILPHFGWRGAFVAGGIIPLLLVAVSIFVLRESVRFMVIRNAPIASVKVALRHLTGVSDIHATSFTPEAQTLGVRGSSVALILSSSFRGGTLLLWLTYFMGMLIYYLVTSWLPTLIRDSGLPLQHASLVAALLPLGATVGAIACGWLMDRVDPHRLIATTMCLMGIFLLGLGQAVSYTDYLPILTFISGFFTGASLISMPALAAAYYPTQGRASGVSWMLGIGRLGGILGAMLGGLLLQFGFGATGILGLLVVPAFIAAAALLYKNANHRHAPTASPIAADYQRLHLPLPR